MNCLRPNIEKLLNNRNITRLTKILTGRYDFLICRDTAVALTKLGEQRGLDFLKFQLVIGSRFEAKLAAAGLGQLGSFGGHKVLFDFLVNGYSQCGPKIIYSEFVKTNGIHTNMVREVYSTLMSALTDQEKAIHYISKALKITLTGNQFEILHERETGHYEDIPCDICKGNDSFPEGSCWGSCGCHNTWVVDSPEIIEIIPQKSKGMTRKIQPNA